MTTTMSRMGTHLPAGSSHHDSDTHTHVEWYTTAAGSDIPSQPIIAVLIESDAWLTAPLSIAPPRFCVNAFTPSPPTCPSLLPLLFFLS